MGKPTIGIGASPGDDTGDPARTAFSKTNEGLEHGIHDDVAGEIAAITEKATPVDADLLLIEDSAASNAKKKAQIGNVRGLNQAQVDARVAIVVPTVYAGWTPGNLGTLPKIWLNETSRQAIIGGLATRWNNLGSLTGDFTQATASKQPSIQPAILAGKNALRFDGSADVLAADAGLLGLYRNIDYAWSFAVYYLDTSSAASRELFFAANNAGSTRFGLSSATGSTVRPQVGGRRLDGDAFKLAVDTTDRDKEWVMALGIIDYGVDTITLFVNGAQVAQTTSAFGATGSTSDTDSSFVGVGDNSGGTVVHIGEEAEVIASSSTGGAAELSAADIDKLFGYAAWKWGLVDSLAGGHPYKSAPPPAP